MTRATANTDARLAARMRALAGAIPRDAILTDRVLARIAADGVRPQSTRCIQLRRWIVRTSLGLAAAFGLAASVWSLLGTPRPAFAVVDVVARLRSLHSLHLKGEFSGGKHFGGPHPLEVFLREPDCMRVDGTTVNDNGHVSVRDMICAPDRFTMINHTDKTVTAISAPPEARNATRLRAQVDDEMQGCLQMMFGPDRSAAFRRVRSETIAGVATDVYQCSLTAKDTVTVWFNPASQLPVRTESDGVRFDTIEANPTLPDAVFHPPVPVGYAVVQPKRVGTTKPFADTGGGFLANHAHMNVTTLLALPNGDLLLCWHLFDERAPAQDLKLPAAAIRMAFTGGRGETYAEHLLHADETPGGWHWRWSLLRPDKPPHPGAVVIVTIAVTDGGELCSSTDIALTFPRDALAHRIEAAQRRTLPGSATPMTLEQIEAAAAGK